AKKMSQGTVFVRVDCYIISEKIYIGELTFFPWGGFMQFKDEAVNRMLGDCITLPPKTDVI
ncbi:MAG: ATP-grasp fold amidoligase family protein, partial [Christensenella sp.]